MQGTSFGHYQLIELLGRGGMGEVWRAHDTAIDRIVAIKILPAEISQDETFQKRFRREAHAAARLRSPHIVPIHTHGEIDGRLFVEMQLIDGRDLQSILDRGPLPPARAVSIIEQIAKALNAAHKVGLLHRDVKPSNILIDDDNGDAYLIDFGIALAVGERGLTTVGDVIGTFHYMAPERFKAQEPGAPPIDARSDIYALACVLYECLTAEHAFRGDSLEQQIGNHLVTPPPRPSNTNPGLPRTLDGVIAKGMAKNPADRYSTALELARAARQAITAPVPVPRPPEPRPPVRRPPTAPQPPMPRPRADYGRRPVPAPPTETGPETLRKPALNPNTPVRREQVIIQPPASPSPALSTPQPTPPSHPSSPARPWWRGKGGLVAAAAVVTVAAVVGAIAFLGHNGSPPTNCRQTTLPFTGLRLQGLSVDSGGTVYVADTSHNDIFELPANGQVHQMGLQGLNFPTGVTADSSGNIYVNDAGNKRVVKVEAGTRKLSQLQFTGLEKPTGLAVDSAGTVYVTDTVKNKVFALDRGSGAQREIPFTGLNSPTGLVVGKDGKIYVADGGNKIVLVLDPRTNKQDKVPFADLSDPGGLTVDGDGSVYVTDRGDNSVLKLSAGSSQQAVLGFCNLDYPWGLAVANNGTVYVAGNNNKVYALPQK
ncbi:serine/threonine protein kinase [Mycobacterium sp. 852002-51163_SCH5372311]|uniref:serine/threonine-protein kinase PknD n=1 Tax=Mycobacterium sp. 852002-51163_SCH5372311 TaxID=1834097 RepID=UPI0007FF4304|nr:serine/threonine-protein kinase PknD [Mycobacterium sp. 852002-51163_SCH5372311]OBF86044.1 serine/threonine protein kinase [Mycobacterium sp. 852002-51163_SCH5372311]